MRTNLPACHARFHGALNSTIYIRSLTCCPPANQHSLSRMTSANFIVKIASMFFTFKLFGQLGGSWSLSTGIQSGTCIMQYAPHAYTCASLRSRSKDMGWMSYNLQPPLWLTRVPLPPHEYTCMRPTHGPNWGCYQTIPPNPLPRGRGRSGRAVECRGSEWRVPTRPRWW